jgi:hypothetical protein
VHRIPPLRFKSLAPHHELEIKRIMITVEQLEAIQPGDKVDYGEFLNLTVKEKDEHFVYMVDNHGNPKRVFWKYFIIHAVLK